MYHPLCESIYLTQIFNDFECDVFLPKINENFYRIVKKSDIKTEDDKKFRFIEYKRVSEECQYLNLISNILLYGNRKADRTGTGTMSIFGTDVKIQL